MTSRNPTVPVRDQPWTYLIVGAGPAGIQMAYELQQAGRDYVVLEAGETPGTFFRQFPRHRTMISINKVHTGYADPEINLRWDWNSLLSERTDLLLGAYSKRYFPDADTYVRYLTDFAAKTALNIRYGVRVEHINKQGNFFCVEDTEARSYYARRLIVATGIGKAYLPPIPGIELAERYEDVSVDPEDFAGQRVLILGKGNSAFETADNLIATTSLLHLASPNPLTLAWKSRFVGHLRAVNNNLLDTYQLKSQNAILDATVVGIEKRGEKLAATFCYTHANGEVETFEYDRVIVCTGFRFDASLFDVSCRPALTINNRFPCMTSAWESPDVPDLYFAGAPMQVRDYKKGTSAFIHGFRYNIRALHRILEQRYHQRPWPGHSYKVEPSILAKAVLARVNRSSALWQQHGVLTDLIVIDKSEARYYEEVPNDFAADVSFGPSTSTFRITMEFGEVPGDPFNIERFPNADQAGRGTFLHPVVRCYQDGERVEEHHVLENLLSDYTDPQSHIRPLVAFFERHLRHKRVFRIAPGVGTT